MSETCKWLIWSNEHNAWWAPNGRGYVQNRTEAGRYTLAEAMESCDYHGNPPGELMIPEHAPDVC